MRMDKSYWFCGDVSACWCGKVGVEGGGSQLEGWTNRVGFVVTFRLVGAGKTTLKVVVSSWGIRISECSARGHLTVHVGPTSRTWDR